MLTITKEQLELIKNRDKSISNYKSEKILGISSRCIRKYDKILAENPNYQIVYPYNENYFEVINSEAKAYWLGFIAADGCVLSTQPVFSINLSQKDIGLLTQMATDLEYNNKIYKFSHKLEGSGNISYMANISIRSKKFTQDLLKYGIHPNKSLDLFFPDNLDSIFIRHWIRGYIDGDGSFGWNKLGNRLSIKILGTYNTLEAIKKNLELTCSIINYGKIHCLTTGGNKIMTRVGHYLYDQSSYFLKRKRTKFDKLLGTIEGGF